MPNDHPRSLLRPSGGRTRVKVCCIASIEEAALALDAGADALGLVSAMPSGPGVITDARVAEVAAWARTRIPTVLLTSRCTAQGIAAQLAEAAPDIVQLCDALGPMELEALRRLAPAIALMQVIHVRDADGVRQGLGVAAYVDAILLDSGNPAATVKELGGTGRVHDWAVSRALRDAVPRPVFLAGGLRAENVASAIATVHPHGVDVCSGVRQDGRLDERRVRTFIAAVRQADLDAGFD